MDISLMIVISIVILVLSRHRVTEVVELMPPHQNLWVGLPRVTDLKLCFQRFWLISNRGSSGGQISKPG